MKCSTKNLLRLARCADANPTRTRCISRNDVLKLCPASRIRSFSHSTPHGYWNSEEVTVNSIIDPQDTITYNPVRQTFDMKPKDNSTDSITSSIQSEGGKYHAKAYIAIGGNLGNRLVWIERALQELKSCGIIIKRTSSLWETEPMYVTDQDSFLNGVIEVETTLEPTPLLRVLQHIENILGRHKIQDKGPRNIDLDILLYDKISYKTDDLIIPHALMLEREFVLRPLAELIPYERDFHPHTESTPSDLLAALPPPTSPMYSLSFLHSSGKIGRPIIPRQSGKPTFLMGILNATPDSFSDGGKYWEAKVPETSKLSTSDTSSDQDSSNAETSTSQINYDGIKYMLRYLYDKSRPSSIIDIGGQSTAPGTPEVDTEEEIARVVPIIAHLHKYHHGKLISIDTYRASVAQAALDAGAHIVNDVSAGTMDPDMLSTVAKAGCSIILMHMRGTPATMTKLTTYPDGLIPTIATELLSRVRAAEEAGIYRWRIILDPGIGFAKTAHQNLEILRDFEKLRNWPGLEGFPWLVGSSRKGFIGKATDMEVPNQRMMGSMVAVAAAVQGGADIVRVHDAKMAVQTVKMADAIWRGWKPVEKVVKNGQYVNATGESSKKKDTS